MADSNWMLRLDTVTMSAESITGGTGSQLARATVIVAGVASLVATLLSFVYAIYTYYFRLRPLSS